MLKISSSIKKNVLAFLLLFLFSGFTQADALDQLREQLRQGLENAQRQLQEQLQAPQQGAQNGQPVLAEIVVVPSVLGYDPTQATDILQGSGLVLGKVEEIISGKPAGTIVAQHPAQGNQAVVQSRVDVMIAIGDNNQSVPLDGGGAGAGGVAAEAVVPELRGLSVAQVRAALANKPFQLGDVVVQPAKKDDGLVIDQHPPAGQVSATNQVIDIIVAKVDEPQKPAALPPLQVSLMLDRQQVNQGESVVMTAKTSRNEPNLEYSFNIGGKAHPSNAPSMTYRFDKAGRFPVTASARPRGKAGGWVHSKSLRVEVVNAEQPTDALVTVPEVIGLSLQDAIKALQENGLRVGLLSQQETTQLEDILEQQPAAGSKVEKDTAVNLVEASKQTQQQANEYELTLAASKETVDVKEPVAFQALLSPMPDNMQVSYRFIVNGENFKSDTNSWTHEFTKSGRYEVIAAAMFEGQMLARSNALSLTVDTFWQEPKAVIKPASLVVTQGDGASFVSQSSQDPASKLQQVWTDESGQNSQGEKHTIDTTDMEPGDYWVTLRIKDERGFESIARAQLIVAAASNVASDQNPADVQTDNAGGDSTTEVMQNEGQTTLLENVTVQLELLASAKHIFTGDRVKFTIVQYPGHTNPANMNYHIIFGDDEHAEITQPWIEHQYQSFGIHQAYVTTRTQNGLVKSASVSVWVWPWWLLAGIFLTIIFFIWKLLAPLFKLSARSKQRADDQAEQASASNEAPVAEQAPVKESVVSYVPEKDYGEQSVDEKVRKEPSFDVTFQADKDAGEQTIIENKRKPE